MAGGLEGRLDLGAEEEVGYQRGDARHHCERRRRNSRRADSGRPHICIDLDAAAAHLAHGQLAGDAGVVEQLQGAVRVAGTAAAWPKLWATSTRQCQS